MIGRAVVVIGLTILVWLTPRPADAAFHIAVIDEVMSSYGGDPTVQFVEIRILAAGQNVVSGSQLGVFDASGAYIGKVMDITANVPNGGSGVRWIMGSAQFASVSSLSPDFTFSGPIFLPTAGGMVCWGKPGNPATPGQYVDCLAYGTYSGPPNSLIGSPTSQDAVGHSLVRVSNSNNNSVDFVCTDPASPTNNTGASVSMMATSLCVPTPTRTETPTRTATATATATPTPVLTCAPGPLPCKVSPPGKSKFQVAAGSGPAKKKLSWSWTKGEATTATELGDPTMSTNYAVCVYDGNGTPILEAAVPAGSTCSGKPCWKQSGKGTPKGFTYKDKLAAMYGIAQISIKVGDGGKAKATVKGKGSALSLLDLLPPTQDPAGLRVQLVNSDGKCWGATYSAPPRSDPASTSKFKDSND